MIDRIANYLDVPANVVAAVAGVYGILAVASLIVFALGREKQPELAARVKSWWVMVTVFAVAVFINQAVSAVFLAFISYLALKEFFSMIPSRRIDRLAVLAAYLSIPVQYWFAYTAQFGLFSVFIPVWMFLLLPTIMALGGQTDGYLKSAGTLSWGLMMTVFTLSHMAYLLFSGDAVAGAVAGGAGLLFFLVFLTQFNDVAQFTWGKLFGKHKITPSVSPKKTWEGFLGGLGTTILLAMFIGPWLTPMDWQWSAAAGAIIAIAGFLGDITESAVKRDMGVKDAGALIPGHGGILDRIDSLTFAAPAFTHFFRYFFYP
ncbi:MAG: phosphatidate cytidylyltransferase [Rhizobiales bacterium]|nr:phosphatidate cytidylyltransferase [Hyphomicrobiales bacterium]